MFRLIHRVEGMKPGRISKQLMDYTPRGKIFIRRPKLRWKDQPVLWSSKLIERSKP
jgi:hypothetical protein